MRVLMLNNEYPPLGGGAANANRYLLREFADEDDLRVDLVTASPDDDREEAVGENVRIYRLDVAKGGVHHWTRSEILRYSWRAYRTSRALAAEHGYDLVHAWFGVPGGVIARALGLPYIVALRGSDVPGYNDRFDHLYPFLRPLIRHVWTEAEAVIANSNDLQELALETKALDIKVIPNGVDADEFVPGDDDHEPMAVLCVARLVGRKGIASLVEAAARANVELTIVGEGTQAAALRDLASRLGVADRVTFVGYVPHDEISDYYRRADAFVLPSFNEGMSNTLLEAMSAGLPVVTSDTGGTAELIDGNGFVVSAGDSAAIRDALSTYADDGELRHAHGRRSREIAEGMSWSRVANQYRQMYDSV